MTTRAEFLTRIRAQMAKTSGRFASQTAARPAHPAEAADLVRRQLAERWRETIEAFRTEFERVGGVFHRIGRPADIPPVIVRLARERDTSDLVAWHPGPMRADFRAALSAEGLRTNVTPMDGTDADRRAMRAAAAVAGLGVTGVDLAIAETGTLVLRSGPGRPRSTSLLPPCHVAVFDPTRLVETLEQAGLFLEEWHAADTPGANVNFITGPSRTADIELTLTRGVHGPKEVHAIFVEGGLDG